MKILVLILAMAGGGWYWFVGAKRVSESDVHALYTERTKAFAERDAKALCDGVADTFSGSDTMVSAAGRANQTADKAKACSGYEDFFASAKKLEATLPGGFQIDTHQDLKSIEISPDKKRATVRAHSVIKMGNPQMLLMQFTTESTDTFERRNGKLKLVSQTSKTVVE